MELKDFMKHLNVEELDTVTGGLSCVVACCILFFLIQKISYWYRVGRKTPPGPLGLPFVGYLPFFEKEPHKALLDMREKYGNVISVKMGTKYVVFLNEYNVLKEVWNHPYGLDKAPDLFEHLKPAGLLNANGEDWAEQRKYCLAASKDLGLGKDHWEDLIMDETTSFVEYLQKLNGKPTEISHELVLSVISNIGSLLIGRRLDKEKEADKLELLADYSNVALVFSGSSALANLIPGMRKLLRILKISGYDKAAKTVKDFGKFAREEIDRHKNSPELKSQQDFINIYLEKLSEISTSQNKKNNYFSEVNLQGNVGALFLGASDTIASSLGYIFRYMCKFKHVQDKVYTEIMENVGKDGRARYEERNNFPYTFAMMMEAQRFGSNVPLTGHRKAAGNIPVNGYIIPKGAEICANLWAMHYDPDYWDQPEVFRPERFLTPDGKALIKHPKSYVPFSVGKRNCPGERIAWMAILFYFTEIIKKFEISTPPGIEPDFNVICGLVNRLTPQPLCFKERKK
ncbi:methyl farnesoate epoxidase [Caerostris darwini]|uniref:Methyl farnesoate epoxidase n=1 Tax=Caerostris darwini TaxID=1538125 RepID=A0AAV4VRW5_9ARAC|nr:methyl farnesoate epoxidase [Caerostris darwini]